MGALVITLNVRRLCSCFEDCVASSRIHTYHLD
jgi:hypothetical protein